MAQAIMFFHWLARHSFFFLYASRQNTHILFTYTISVNFLHIQKYATRSRIACVSIIFVYANVLRNSVNNFMQIREAVQRIVAFLQVSHEKR